MNPVYVAANKRMLIFGVPRMVFIVAVIGAAVIAGASRSFVSGVVVFSVIFYAARWLTGKDPKLISVIAGRFRLSSLYDSGR